MTEDDGYGSPNSDFVNVNIDNFNGQFNQNKRKQEISQKRF